MIYNIGLIFNEEINEQIYSFYTKIKNDLNLDFGLKKKSIPHATIIKFESQSEMTKK